MGLRWSRCEMGAGEAACQKMQILSPPHPAGQKGSEAAHEGCVLLASCGRKNTWMSGLGQTGAQARGCAGS